MKITLIYKKNLLFCFIFFSMFFICGMDVKASDNYQIVQNQDVITGTNNGITITDAYVCLKSVNSQMTVVKPGTKDGKVYYFDPNGVGTVYMKCNFIPIIYNGKSQFYYSNGNGTLEKNKIVGNKTLGYYYVDTSGVQIKSTAAQKKANKNAQKKGNYKKTDYNAQCIEYAVKFVRAHGGSGSNKTKLKKCFLYLSSHYKYKRVYTNLYPKSAIMDDFAYEMFSSKRGNCHRYAAAFVYIARVLGYDGMTLSGETTSRSGGWTPHGWTKIKNGSKWYVCDPDMQMMGVSAYMKSVTPSRTRKGKVHRLYAKDGKVYWK